MPPAPKGGNLSLGQGTGLTGVGGWGEAAHQFGDRRDVGLEVLPPRCIPCRQNKQGGACACGQIWPSWKAACGRSQHPFILGGMENGKLGKQGIRVSCFLEG